MLIDFRELKNEVNQVIGKLDHIYLNELEEFRVQNPTAENIACYIYSELKKKQIFGNAIIIRSVKVWESPKSAVTYSEDSIDDKCN